MRLKNVSSACYALGLFVGGAASMGLLVGFEPARLPAAVLNVAAYKLTFIASLVLLGAGAAIARYARRVEGSSLRGDPRFAGADEPGQLGAAQDLDALESASRPRDAEHVPVRKSPPDLRS